LDDPAPTTLPHPRRKGVNQVHRTGDILIVNLDPFRGRGIPPAVDVEHTGVVDEDVNAAERSEGGVGDALRFDIAAEIADRNRRAAPD
jgi:hypothetical protein